MWYLLMGHIAQYIVKICISYAALEIYVFKDLKLEQTVVSVSD